MDFSRMHKKYFVSVQFNDWVCDKTKWCMKFFLTLVSFLSFSTDEEACAEKIGGFVLKFEY